MANAGREIVYGREVATGRRISLPLAAHTGKMVQIRGETGGGKSLLMTQLLLQYLGAGSGRKEASLSPVVIIDLGGDLFTFNVLLDRCKQLGRTFKWLSLDPLDETYYFDPLQSCKSLEGSSGRKANFVTAGLNLAYSEGFGTGYFGRLNFSTIREAIVRLEKKSVPSPSLLELGEELSLMARRQRGSKEAAEALYALDQLLDYEALRQTNDATKRIDIDQSLEYGDVLYFFLPTLQETLAARAVGTLAAWSVINAAAYRQKTGRPKKTIPLVIDEAAQVVHGQSFQDALVLSRKYGIRIHIIHQSEAQLRSSRGTDMSQVVRDNCAIKAFFTTDIGDKNEVGNLLGYSKLEKTPRLGLSTSGLKTTTSQQEHDEPILKQNTIADTNSTFGEFFLVFKDGSGHREPVRLMSEFPTTKDKHDELSRRPIPQKFVAIPDSAEKPIDIVKVDASGDLPRAPKLDRQLKALIGGLQAEEQWKLTGSSR